LFSKFRIFLQEVPNSKFKKMEITEARVANTMQSNKFAQRTINCHQPVAYCNFGSIFFIFSKF
jgi:hypothetical protein